ncbi:MAG: T9SS type A sorting domain-containing protein [Ignavibacterium sp.]|nr:MAG: T9SS type A sorting domain-containing protein [Ignavibacterium sp.]
MYFDVGAGGNALPPAHGSTANDMGHCGGPASLWYLWDWPMPVESDSYVITDFVLMNNYPNPFNSSTIIKYDVKELTMVELKVFDILGREVATLVNDEKPVGNYEIVFDAMGLPSGVYFYRLHAGDFVETKKMVLIR